MEITRTSGLEIFSSSVPSENFVTRSANTCPFIVVWGMYLISTAHNIVPYLAILPI